jgi:hypothetical protein
MKVLIKLFQKGSCVINVQKVILWRRSHHTPARDCHLWTLDKRFKQTLSEFLPLFLQKESGFQGKALIISTGEKAFCTLFTDERSKVCRVRGDTPNPNTFAGDYL